MLAHSAEPPPPEAENRLRSNPRQVKRMSRVVRVVRENREFREDRKDREEREDREFRGNRDNREDMAIECVQDLFNHKFCLTLCNSNRL